MIIKKRIHKAMKQFNTLLLIFFGKYYTKPIDKVGINIYNSFNS